jgi:hypothetical protein
MRLIRGVNSARIGSALLVLLLFLTASADGGVRAAPLRAGIIGLDTSHSVHFTRILNDPGDEGHVPGCRVVAAYPQGSRDIESSVRRVPEYTRRVREMGVEIVPSIEALLEKVDVVLLETNDGRPHLEQAAPVLKAGKPVFIDKPVAGTLADVVAIYELSKRYGTPVFSSSALRYAAGVQEAVKGKVGKILACDAYSPAVTEPNHPDLFWYGIHGVEFLYTVMGPGCVELSRMNTPGGDVVVGRWSDGRLGTFHGRRAGKRGYGGTAFGSEAIAPLGGFSGYPPLVARIVEFFQTRVPPVDPATTLEIYVFMEAADESKRRGGAPVRLQDVLEKARIQARKILTDRFP